MNKAALFGILAIILMPIALAALEDPIENTIGAQDLPAVSATIEDKATIFLDDEDIVDTTTLQVSKSYNESDEEAFIFYEQEHNGVPVYNSLVGVIIRHGEVVMVKKRYYDNLNVNTNPTIKNTHFSSISNSLTCSLKLFSSGK